MLRKRSIGLGLAIALTSALALSAYTASGSTTASATSAPSGTLKVLVLDGTQQQALVAAFQKRYPKVKVVNNTTNNNDLQNNGVRLLGSSDAPDVSFMWNDSRYWPTLIKNHELLDITDVWKKSGLYRAYSQTVQTMYESKKKPYGVNIDLVWAPVVYYNKSLFSKAGITPPNGRVATMSDWNTIVTKLKAIGTQPFAVGGSDFNIGQVLDQELQTASTPAQLLNYFTSWRTGVQTAKYNSGPYLDALGVFKAWQDAGVFAKGVAAMTGEQADALFLSGGAGMVQSGSWAPAGYRGQHPSFDFGWFLLPPIHQNNPSKFLTANGDAFVIPKAAKHKDLAKLFLEFVMSKSVQTSIVGASAIPARSDINPAALKALDPVDQSMLSNFAKLGTSSLWSVQVPAALDTPALADFTAVLTGQMTPQQAGDSVQQAFLTLPKP